jgi:hypothetical protein
MILNLHGDDERLLPMDADADPLYRLCAWCNREIDEDGNACGPEIPKAEWPAIVTHGICRACEEEQLRLAELHQ